MNERFEAAVEAVMDGDAATLRRLLAEQPTLATARSSREHRATLLHYTGANGVEGERQRTPKNVIAIAEILLDAGADVNSIADLYGGSTTLGLVATSIHPHEAGVQLDLIDFLLGRGAAIEEGLINSCLANGRPAAASHLALRGAALDLEGAAGLGRLDLVRSLLPSATPHAIKSGMQWACEYGHLAVVEFLLPHVDVAEVHRGQTPLHWAACGGHVEIVRLLLAHGAPLDVRDERWNATPRGWAEYCGKREAAVLLGE